MANIKSAKKRILVNETRAARNKAIRSKVKTSIKKVEASISAGDKAAAQANLVNAISEIEKLLPKAYTTRTMHPARYHVSAKLSAPWLKSFHYY